MIKESLDQVGEIINATCIRADEGPEEVTLIAVSRTKLVPTLEEAYAAGTRGFGEDKVQEILAKKPELPQDIRWYMISHFRHSKVGQVIDNAVMIHSVGSPHLARQVEAEAARKEVDVDILLEVNAARGESKHGFVLEEVEDAVTVIKDFPCAYVKGFMTATPFVDNPRKNRGISKKLFEFAVDIGKKNVDSVIMGVLSMGMTGGHKVVIEGGATMVRVDTDIFGIR